MDETEKARILAEQAPRVEEARERLKTPGPRDSLDPSLIEKIILRLREKFRPAPPPPPQPEAQRPKTQQQQLMDLDAQYRSGQL